MNDKSISQAILSVKTNFLLALVLLFCLTLSLKYLNLAFDRYYSPTDLSMDNHFTLLAQSFMNGRLDLKTDSYHFPNGDLALFKDKYYVYFGPVPAILAFPGVFFFGDKFPSSTLCIIAAILIAYLIMKIGRKHSFEKQDLIWLAVFFIFGTVFSSLIFSFYSSYQVHIISTLFIFLALYEYYYKKRYNRIGFFVSLAMATRFTLIFAIGFFMISLLLEKLSRQEKILSLFKLLTPIIITLILLLLYNLVRFGNIFQTGYAHNVNILFPSLPDFGPSLKHGLFSLYHIPRNLYYFLFKGPDLLIDPSTNLPVFPYLTNDGWGLSIIFTSPLLVVPFFFLKIKKYLAEIITILLISFPIFTYFGIGYLQFGYRYAMDFYPFLFIILLKFLQGELSLTHKILITYSVIFNMYYIFSFYQQYPFFLF